MDLNQIDAFGGWIESQGWQLGAPTKEWEVLRDKTPEDGTLIIYRNSKNRLRVPDATEDHFAHFMKAKKCRPAGKYRSKAVQRLLERDGDCCLFCGLPLGDDITVEHLIAKTKGGNNSIENMALAHEVCNHEAGDMGLVDKIDLIVRKRRNG